MGPMGSSTWDVCVCTHCKISIIVLTIVLAINAQYIYIAKISSSVSLLKHVHYLILDPKLYDQANQVSFCVASSLV